MRALIQRVRSASVSIDDEIIGKIGRGLVILLGIRTGDTKEAAQFLSEKCVNLRIFSDSAGKFNLSALDVGAEILVVSQFTLYGDCRKGRRPNFMEAAPPSESSPLYDHFLTSIQNFRLRIVSGKFGADMLVDIKNEGPVTIFVDSK